MFRKKTFSNVRYQHYDLVLIEEKCKNLIFEIPYRNSLHNIHLRNARYSTSITMDELYLINLLDGHITEKPNMRNTFFKIPVDMLNKGDTIELELKQEHQVKNMIIDCYNKICKNINNMSREIIVNYIDNKLKSTKLHALYKYARPALPAPFKLNFIPIKSFVLSRHMTDVSTLFKSDTPIQQIAFAFKRFKAHYTKFLPILVEGSINNKQIYKFDRKYAYITDKLVYENFIPETEIYTVTFYEKLQPGMPHHKSYNITVCIQPQMFDVECVIIAR